LTDAEEESHCSLPEVRVPVLPKLCGILEQEYNAQQKSAYEAKKEAEEKDEAHGNREMICGTSNAKTLLIC
jgi:hypothetical protein